MDEIESLKKQLADAKQENEDLRLRLRNIQYLYLNGLKELAANDANLESKTKIPAHDFTEDALGKPTATKSCV